MKPEEFANRVCVFNNSKKARDLAIRICKNFKPGTMIPVSDEEMDILKNDFAVISFAPLLEEIED